MGERTDNCRGVFVYTSTGDKFGGQVQHWCYACNAQKLVMFASSPDMSTFYRMLQALLLCCVGDLCLGGSTARWSLVTAASTHLLHLDSYSRHVQLCFECHNSTVMYVCVCVCVSAG